MHHIFCQLARSREISQVRPISERFLDYAGNDKFGRFFVTFLSFFLVVGAGMGLSSLIMYWDEKKPRWINARVAAWAIFDLATTIYSMNIISKYIGLWSVEQHGGSVPGLNITVSMSILATILLQIVLSPISDELGKRRVFVVWFTLLSIVSCGLISKVHDLNLGLALFALSNLGYQTAAVFYNAMLGDVTDKRHESRVSGIGVGVGYIGTIIGLPIADSYATSGNCSPVFLVTAVMVFIFSLPLFLFVREKPSLVRLNFKQSLRNSVGAFTTTLRRVARNREMLLFFIACILCLDAVHTVIINMVLYCKTVVGLDPVKGVEWSIGWMDRKPYTLRVNEITAFIITSTTFGIFGAFVFGHIADKVSRYYSLVVVIIIWITALVLAIFSVQKKMFWYTGPLFGIGFGGIWTVSRAYLQELAHPEERGQMFALFGLANRCAAVIGPLVWAGVFAWCEPSMGERKAYRCAIGAVLGLMIIGFWILLLAKPKDENPTRLTGRV
jgi:MFS transporter, UMF1 family